MNIEIYASEAAKFAAIYGTICVGAIAFAIWQIKKKWFKPDKDQYREIDPDADAFDSCYYDSNQ